jgi:drug/metabolite transporter (DMT)-like permease
MSMSRGTQIDWLLFVLLGFFWGSSYLFIKIGVDAGLAPFTLVTLRLLVGAIFLVAVVFVAREQLPRRAKTYGHLIVLGFFAIALPFALITTAELRVDSALAATLTAPVPLFVIPIAAIVLHERITINKVFGVIVGLIGVAVLMGFDPAQIGRSDLSPQLALVGAAASYALAGVYARKYVHGLRPMIPALFQVLFALAMSAGAALVTENPLAQIGALNMEAIFSVLWLGLLGSGMAYLAFYRLLNHWGPTRTSLVAYTLPVWGIALGFLVLAEPITEGLILGTALVIAGIAFVNVRPQAVWIRARQMRERMGSPEPSTVDPSAGPR